MLSSSEWPYQHPPSNKKHPQLEHDWGEQFWDPNSACSEGQKTASFQKIRVLNQFQWKTWLVSDCWISWALVPFIHYSALGLQFWAMNTQPGLHTRDIGFWLTGSLADQAASASAWGHSIDTVLRDLFFSQWLQCKNVDSTHKFSPFLVGYPWLK